MPKTTATQSATSTTQLQKYAAIRWLSVLLLVWIHVWMARETTYSHARARTTLDGGAATIAAKQAE